MPPGWLAVSLEEPLVSAAAPVSRYAAALFSVENIGRSGGALRCAGCASQVDPWTHQLCGQRTLLRQWALDRELPAHSTDRPHRLIWLRVDLIEGVDCHDTLYVV